MLGRSNHHPWLSNRGDSQGVDGEPLNKVIHPGGEHHSARRIPIARRHRRKVADIDPRIPEGGRCFGEGRAKGGRGGGNLFSSAREISPPPTFLCPCKPLFRLLDHSTDSLSLSLWSIPPLFYPRFSPLDHGSEPRTRFRSQVSRVIPLNSR